MSKVMQNSSGKIKFPINEPCGSRSHIDEYLELNGGPGVQHIAIQTSDIVKSVELLRQRGVEFASIPRAYYAEAASRFSDIPTVDIELLAKHQILVDRDEDGYLLQIFTKGRTLFFELIERHGCKSFGHNNFRALFEAKERERIENEKKESAAT
jgi:4-hydroxyphenylpyruvate dioxygenase